MYTQDFYITDSVGNNAFSYHERKNKKLFIPALKKIESFEEVELALTPKQFSSAQHLTPTLSQEEREQMQEKVTFEDFDFDEKLQTCYGLKNLYELRYNPFSHNTSPSIPLLTGEGSRSIPVYLVDNHNHVFYFWYLARKQGIISDGAILYHVDEHADMRDPGSYLLKPDSQDLQKVFEYTNFFLNVGNFIVPAMKEGLIGEVIQIRSEGELSEYLLAQNLTLTQPSSTQNLTLTLSSQEREQTTKNHNYSFPLLEERKFKGEVLCGDKPSLILNLDLDFFEPELDYIDFELKKQVILDIAAKADLITICTSPFFIEQERALRVLKEIFD